MWGGGLVHRFAPFPRATFGPLATGDAVVAGKADIARNALDGQSAKPYDPAHFGTTSPDLSVIAGADRAESATIAIFAA
jgi:hypothetical protein